MEHTSITKETLEEAEKSVIITLGLITELLKDIDNNNPDRGIVTSFRIFSDGSGRIMQSPDVVVANFNTPTEAVKELQDILDKCRKVKK
jgi:hypothetical protein